MKFQWNFTRMRGLKKVVLSLIMTYIMVEFDTTIAYVMVVSSTGGGAHYPPTPVYIYITT